MFGVGFVGLFVLWETRSITKRGSSFKNFFKNNSVFLVALGLFLVIILQSYLRSTRLADSFIRIWDLACCLLVFYLIRVSFLKERKRKQLLYILLAISTLYSLLAYCYFFDWIPHPWWEKAEFVSSTFVNHNHFAGFHEMIIFLSLGMVLSRRDENVILFLFLLMIQWGAFLLSLSRGGWISFFLTLFFMSCLLIGDRRLRGVGLKIFASLILVIVAFLAFIQSEVNPSMSKRFDSFFTKEGQTEFLDFRVKLWDSTYQAILKAPKWGYGLGSFSWEMRPFRQKGFPYKFDYTHNDYLQFAMELGGVLFIACLLWILWIMSKSLLNFYSTKLYFFRFEELGMLCGVLCILIHGVVDFNLHIFSNTILFVVFLALISIKTLPEKQNS
ncbi:MAG: O-antigen ligase family protein [Candidatus Cloacimonetes bacterium]|nr:O-antigen ligase family protein [Candidatus Cloacimonadota bacterium]